MGDSWIESINSPRAHARRHRGKELVMFRRKKEIITLNLPERHRWHLQLYQAQSSALSDPTYLSIVTTNIV